MGSASPAAVSSSDRLGEDRLVEPPGLGQRLDAQLVAQQARQLLVLGEGPVALAREGAEAHQLAVRLLRERLDGDQPAGVVDAEAVLAPPPVALDEPAQRLDGRLAQAHLLGDHPVLEAGLSLTKKPARNSPR